MTQKKHIVKELTLSEISGVTIPAQSHALATILKAESVPMIEEITKALSTRDGAASFNDFMASDSEQCRQYEAMQEVWPLLSALQSSVNSIVIDTTLSPADYQDKIRESVSQFVVAMQSPDPDASYDVNEMTKIFTNREVDMSEELKKAAAALEAQVAELTKKLNDADVLSKMSDAEKAHLASLDAAAADKFKASSPEDRKGAMKKIADSDEVFKSVHGVDIRKSDVGAVVFDIFKAQDAEIAKSRAEITKANERARTVELTKQADDEFKHLPGETVVKVAVLKSMDAMGEAERTALTAMLKAADVALSGGFIEKGTSGGVKEDIAKAEKLESLAKAFQVAHPGTSIEVAKTAVLTSNPELYEG